MSDSYMHPEQDRTSGIDINDHENDPVAGRILCLEPPGSSIESPMPSPGTSTAFTVSPPLKRETACFPREIHHQSHGVSINCMHGKVRQRPNRDRTQNVLLRLPGFVKAGLTLPMDGQSLLINNR